MSADPWASLPPGGGPRPGGRTVPADDALEDTDLRPAIGYGDAHGTMRFGTPPEEAVNHTMVVSPGTIVPGFDDPDYDDGRYGRRRSRRGDGEPLLQRLLFSRRLIYVLGALAAVLAAVLLGWYLTSGQQLTVPKVTSWSQGLARKELKGLGLTVRVGAPRHSDIATGLIVGTDPRAGATIASHGTVTLHLSLGPVKVQVPSVAGEPVQQAIVALKGAGLKVGTPVPTPSDTIPVGDVVSTNPAGGALTPKNKPVTVLVSAGPPLPSFVGAQVSAAQIEAQQGGYQLNQVADPKSTQPQGTITGQSPAAGTPVTSGEVVTVNVSNGPPQVAVPDVQGMTLDQATSVLQAAGFQVQVQQGFGNRVTGYSPTGQAPAGSTIGLIVGLAF
jgi:beta-lactam-binding protein with PASTA domain